MDLSQAPLLAAAAVVILIEWVMPLPTRYSPLALCRVIADALAAKVNKTDSTDHQRTIAGFLALLTYIVLIGTLVWALLFVMPYDLVTESVLLYLSMGFHAVSNQSKDIEDALSGQQKSMARSLLAELSRIDVSKLSPLGIIKNTLEVNIMAWLSYWLMPVVLFLLVGGLASFVYAIVITAVNAWPVLNPKYNAFGALPHKFKTWFELPFTLILLPLFSVFKSSPGWLKVSLANRAQWPHQQSFTELLWLSLVAAGCKIEMAGPVMFDGEKVARIRLKAGAAPDQTAISALRHWQHRFVIFSVCLLSLFWLLANVIPK